MLRGLATALLALRFRSPTPLLTAAGENVGFIHVWGLPWELDAAQVAKTLVPMLEETGAALLEPPVLPLDKRARRTGRALCRVRGDDVTATIASLHGKCVGSRWLDVRESDCEELCTKDDSCLGYSLDVIGSSLTWRCESALDREVTAPLPL